MMYTLFPLFSLSLLVIPVGACEGQCIVDITHAFVGNYSVPVQHVFAEAAASIARTILPSRSTAAASKLIEPLLDAYERRAYDAMERGIFPGYFHGKCQVNGVDLAGCPNPDCPVVCGTPGSMVHFYTVLQEIAFNATSTNIIDLCGPSSKTYHTLETAVLHELRAGAPHRHSRRAARMASRLAPYALARRSTLQESDDDLVETTDPRPALQKRREISEGQAKAHLKSICSGTVNSLEKECGGKARLPKCSWEKEMKAFILSFP